VDEINTRKTQNSSLASSFFISFLIFNIFISKKYFFFPESIERSNGENTQQQQVTLYQLMSEKRKKRNEKMKLYVLNQNKQVVDIEKYLHNICVRRTYRRKKIRRFRTF
jgi:hypothetical protein